MGVPLAFNYDYVQSGGLLSKVKDEALIVLNGEHPKNYYKYIFYYSHTKYGTVLKIGIGGTSKHLDKLAVRNAYKEDRKGWIFGASIGENIGYKIGSKIGGSLRSLGGSKKKAAAEQDYYNASTYILQKLGF